jgi:hypothetical protein
VSFVDFSSPQENSQTKFLIIYRFGIIPASPLQVHSPLAPSQSVTALLPLSTGGKIHSMDPYNALQVAVKNNNGIYYFQTTIPLYILFDTSKGPLTTGEFETFWNDGTWVSTSFDVPLKRDDFVLWLSRHGVQMVDQISGNVSLTYVCKMIFTLMR